MDEPWTCERVREGLTDYLEDASPPRVRVGYTKHLLRCPRCAGDLRQIRWTLDQLRGLPPERIPPARRATILKAFHDRQSA